MGGDVTACLAKQHRVRPEWLRGVVQMNSRCSGGRFTIANVDVFLPGIELRATKKAWGRKTAESLDEYQIKYAVNLYGESAFREVPLGPLNGDERCFIETCMATAYSSQTGIALLRQGEGSIGAIIDANRKIAAQAETLAELANKVGLLPDGGGYRTQGRIKVNSVLATRGEADTFETRFELASNLFSDLIASRLSTIIRNLTTSAAMRDGNIISRLRELSVAEEMIVEDLHVWRRSRENLGVVKRHIAAIEAQTQERRTA